MSRTLRRICRFANKVRLRGRVLCAIKKTVTDDFLARGYFGKNIDAARARFDALVEKLNSKETLTETEDADLKKAQSEIASIAAANVLNNADFIRRLVKGEPSRAEKILNKIVRIKNALSGEKGRAANQEIAFVRKSEKLYLDAIAELGGTYRDGKIHLANREEDETVSEKEKSPAEGEVRYSKKGDASDPETQSIKEQLQAHAIELDSMDSVSTVNYTPMNKKELHKEISEVFKKIGYKIDRQGFGIIEIGEKQIDKGLNYINTEAEKAAFFSVPAILKRGVEISGHQNHKNREYSTVTFAAKITVNDTPGIVGVVVAKIDGHNKYRVHRIVTPDGSAFVFEVKNNNAEPTSGEPLLKSKRAPIGSASNNSIAQNSEKSTTSSKNLLENRVSGDDLLNAQDLISDVRDLGGEVDGRGYITLYHRTSASSAAAIRSTGTMMAKEDGLFFSTKENGQNVGYGDSVVIFKIPAEKLVLDDIFDDEAHLRYPLDKPGRVSMKEYLADGSDLKFSRAVKTDGQAAKDHADRNYGKIYTKKDAREIISAALTEHLTFPEDGVFGNLVGKSRAEAIEVLWRGLNSAEEGKRAGLALDMADFIIENAVAEDLYDSGDTAEQMERLKILRGYMHKLDLSSLKAEIEHKLGKKNTAALVWGARKGQRGLGVDTAAMELAERGFSIRADNPADQFFAILDAYRSAAESVKKESAGLSPCAFCAIIRKKGVSVWS